MKKYKKNFVGIEKLCTFAPDFERVLIVESRFSKFKIHISKLSLSYGVTVAHLTLDQLV